MPCRQAANAGPAAVMISHFGLWKKCATASTACGTALPIARHDSTPIGTRWPAAAASTR